MDLLWERCTSLVTMLFHLYSQLMKTTSLVVYHFNADDIQYPIILDFSDKLFLTNHDLKMFHEANDVYIVFPIVIYSYSIVSNTEFPIHVNFL